MRRWTGLMLRAAMLLLAAAMVGRGLPPEVWRWFTPQHLLETAVRLETGAVYSPAETAAPEVVLADLIHIFHPELLPADYKPVFYELLK